MEFGHSESRAWENSKHMFLVSMSFFLINVFLKQAHDIFEFCNKLFFIYSEKCCNRMLRFLYFANIFFYVCNMPIVDI